MGFKRRLWVLSSLMKKVPRARGHGTIPAFTHESRLLAGSLLFVGDACILLPDATQTEWPLLQAFRDAT